MVSPNRKLLLQVRVLGLDGNMRLRSGVMPAYACIRSYRIDPEYIPVALNRAYKSGSFRGSPRRVQIPASAITNKESVI